MDQSRTVFYLVPHKDSSDAEKIYQHTPNSRLRCTDPNIVSRLGPCLRIGLDVPPKSPPHLARFGRHPRNDVVLPHGFSRNDQCYFSFNKGTGELLLFDLSPKSDTDLFDVIYDAGEKQHPGLSQIWKAPRQCVVVLSRDPDAPPGRVREWIFSIAEALFRLVSLNTQDNEVALTEARLAFANQPDPDKTDPRTKEKLLALGQAALDAMTTTVPSSSPTINPHNTRHRTPLEPAADDVIRYTKLRPLGKGGQGDVYKVVDMYNGDHHACKIVKWKVIPQWGIYSEKAFKLRVEKEVNIVQALKYPNIVTYDWTQGFKIGRHIEIFMPIYEGSLSHLIERHRRNRPVLEHITAMMLHQILGALEFVHAQNPPIIHRDIKPANILYQGEKFLLTDFGIAKPVDACKTLFGTRPYMAPEFRQGGDQTPKLDIYALGVTVVVCLAEVNPNEEKEDAQWHRTLQSLMRQEAPTLASMLADVPSQRPTAEKLLKDFFSQFPRPPSRNIHTNTAPPSFGETSTSPRSHDETAMSYNRPLSPMDWTATAATALRHGDPQPMQGDESVQPPQPSPAIVPSTEAPPSRPASRGARRGGTRRGGSVISVASSSRSRRNDNRRNESPQNINRTLSRPARVPKRRGQSQRSSSRSVQRAYEQWVQEHEQLVREHE